MWYVIVFVIGFAAGWAFFKHRAKIKAKAEYEMKKHVSKYIGG
jgi:prolipoprotein diacylglyceryltransferase